MTGHHALAVRKLKVPSPGKLPFEHAAVGLAASSNPAVPFSCQPRKPGRRQTAKRLPQNPIAKSKLQLTRVPQNAHNFQTGYCWYLLLHFGSCPHYPLLSPVPGRGRPHLCRRWRPAAGVRHPNDLGTGSSLRKSSSASWTPGLKEMHWICFVLLGNPGQGWGNLLQRSLHAWVHR